MSLVLKNIRHRYGAAEAVAGVAFDVAAGEIVCLFGPSGCGKTTLLRIVAGLESLQQGSVRFDGTVFAGDGIDLPPERRPIGFVFQDLVLFPHMTAVENVAFGLSSLAGDERRRQARLELAAVGLAGLEDRYPHQLSGGQQQRVALARALARRPRAMLLDEPFASVDPVLRRRLREDLRAILKGSGAATILVTHDAEEALALGDRIALMADGKILEMAAPKELYDEPKTIEGASIFAGAQRLAGKSDPDSLATEVGVAQVRGLPRGEVAIAALPGAICASAAQSGPFVVSECRFNAPGWSVSFQTESGRRLTAAATAPLSPNSRIAITLEAKYLRVFALDGATRPV